MIQVKQKEKIARYNELASLLAQCSLISYTENTKNPEKQYCLIEVEGYNPTELSRLAAKIQCLLRDIKLNAQGIATHE